jgi:hypothetical protein
MISGQVFGVIGTDSLGTVGLSEQSGQSVRLDLVGGLGRR